MERPSEKSSIWIPVRTCTKVPAALTSIRGLNRNADPVYTLVFLLLLPYFRQKQISPLAEASHVQIPNHLLHSCFISKVDVCTYAHRPDDSFRLPHLDLSKPGKPRSSEQPNFCNPTARLKSSPYCRWHRSPNKTSRTRFVKPRNRRLLAI